VSVDFVHGVRFMVHCVPFVVCGAPCVFNYQLLYSSHNVACCLCSIVFRPTELAADDKNSKDGYMP